MPTPTELAVALGLSSDEGDYLRSWLASEREHAREAGRQETVAALKSLSSLNGSTDAVMGFVRKAMGWREDEHKRGQPENAGQFSTTENSESATSERKVTGQGNTGEVHREGNAGTPESQPPLAKEDAEAFSQITGAPGTDASIRALAGIPAAVPLSLKSYSYNGVDYVEVIGESDGYRAKRIFKKLPDGSVVAINHGIRVSKDSEHRGSGTDNFAKQVKALQKAGVARIETTAGGDAHDARRGDGYNGYYTLPRFGYDGRIPEDYLAKLPPELAKQLGGSDSILDLMATPQGRDWWKNNGGEIKVVFDLSDDSRSVKTLQAYQAERAGRAVTKSWNESQHKRDHGKFSSAGGSDGVSSKTDGDKSAGYSETTDRTGSTSDVETASGGTRAVKAGVQDFDTRATTLAARIAEVPAEVARRVSEWVQARYTKLATRYGPTGAKAILGAMVLLAPTPIPGSSLLPVAVAEAVLRLRNAVRGEAMSKAMPPELSDEHIRTLARDLWHELTEEMGDGKLGLVEDRDWVSSSGDSAPHVSGQSEVDDTEANAVLLKALVDAVGEAVESGDDPEAAAEAFRAYIDDPELLTHVLDGTHTGTVTKAWTSDKHPRDKAGRFISKDAMQEAKTNPDKAAELRARVKPEDADKLEDVIAGKEDPGRTRRGQAKHEAGERRKTKAESKAPADELIRKISAGQLQPLTHPISADDLHALADHLPSMTVADLRRARVALHASFGGDTRKEQMVERLKQHAKGQAEELEPTTRLKEKKRFNRAPEDSVLQKVIDYGGIDPNSHELLKNYESMRRATQDGVPMAAFKTGGMGLDELAEQMQASGHINVPRNRDPGEYVLDLLKKRANTLAADTTKEHEDALAEYYRSREEAEREHTAAEVAEAVRSGEEAGRSEGTNDPLEQHGEGTGEPSGTGSRFDPLSLSDEDFDRWIAAGRPDRLPPESTSVASAQPERDIEGATIHDRDALRESNPQSEPDTLAGDSAEEHAAAMRQWEAERPGSTIAENARDRAEGRLASASATAPEDAPATRLHAPEIGSRAEYEEGRKKPAEVAPEAVEAKPEAKKPPKVNKPATDRPKIEYVRAPAGGAISEVNGQHYAGGHMMPVHGKYVGQEKGPKGDGLGSAPTPSKTDSEGEGGGARGSRALSPDELERVQHQHEQQSKWDEMNKGVLGQITWLGNKPNSKGLVPATNARQWKEFAEKHGDEKMKEIIAALKPDVDAKLDAEAERGVSQDGIDWAKGEAERRAKDAEGWFPGAKKHAKQVPNSLLAQQYVHQYMEEFPGVDGRHALEQKLAGVISQKAVEPAPSAGTNPAVPPATDLARSPAGGDTAAPSVPKEEPAVKPTATAPAKPVATLAKLAKQATDPVTRDYLESAAHNLNDSAPPHKVLEQLGARYHQALDEGHAGTAEHLAGVVKQFGGEVHGAKPGQSAAFDGRLYDSDTPVSTGEAVKVVRPPVVLPSTTGAAPYVAAKGKVAPV